MIATFRLKEEVTKLVNSHYIIFDVCKLNNFFSSFYKDLSY